MTGLLICAAVVAVSAAEVIHTGGVMGLAGRRKVALGLALIAVALWLAYAAGAKP